jgi:squalene synthase HpnC
LAHTHYENFTVGSCLVPADKRRHIYAAYAYCRFVDDLGDEASPDSTPPEGRLTPSSARGEGHSDDQTLAVADHRLALLDWWEDELRACYSGTPTHPVTVALQETIRAFQLPPEPFLKLIEANRMDQRVNRYASYADLLHYCDHSANPVGRLFLYLFGYRDAERQQLADHTCTALQLTNFWQDVARDFQKGRVYLPQEDLDRFGYTEEELARGQVNENFRQLLSFQVARARRLFGEGADLVDTLDGAVKLDVALFTRGGVAVLDTIRRQDYDVLTARPSLSRRRKAGLFASTWLTWKLGLGLGLPRYSHEAGSRGRA